ncbi:MAG: ATP-binding protein [Proteobacteria bacterium]|nr:ATP-binding protein [Pseudomonadota bacterium]
MYCAQSQVIYGIYEESESLLWLSTEFGLIRLDKNAHSCRLYTHEKNNPESLSHNTVFSVSKLNKEDWVSITKGLNKLNPESGKVTRLPAATENNGLFFSVEYTPGVLLLGSRKGLYLYDIEKATTRKILSAYQEINDARFYQYSRDWNNDFVFSTDKGLSRLTSSFHLKHINIKRSTIDQSADITAVYADANNGIWLGLNKQYFMLITKDNNIIDYTSALIEPGEKLVIYGIFPDNKNNLWLSSENGLYRFNLETHSSVKFTHEDGLQDNVFLGFSNHKTEQGKLYFGGRKGLNGFYPSDILPDKSAPKIVLTSLVRNKENHEKDLNIKPNNSVNTMKLIEMDHNDYMVEIGFSALEYANSTKVKYAYRLKGLDDRWNFVDANRRQISITNLKANDYMFQVRSLNKHGIWSQNPKELRIKVYPAPWFSPWAYFVYFIMIIFSIWAFIYRRTIASRKRAQQLEMTVMERTQEVNLQKKMVESLLEHKNAVFANITHEFKTPLTLILGPVEQLATKPELIQHADKLNMIKKNAQRLFLMVGQILKLSQTELNKEFVREPQNIKSTLIMLYKSFKPLADDKNITLFLQNNHDVNVYATSECLEIVLGNLLSNALKFTASGGEIFISSDLDNMQISISIKDTGTGIEKKDLVRIFKRFTRLDAHKNTQGTGIGLAVVKEITEANDGEVIVNSEWGKGSEFKVVFPVTELNVDCEVSQAMTDQLVNNTKNELSIQQTQVQNQNISNNIKVLIIEDNLDMQAHIDGVLKKRFYCVYADRGRVGIALALKEMPDIIICDVMMPGMDGYQVSRILRHDARTSHIPIVLLTALNTKESRIKGWRENIDSYVSKPFDAVELNAQLDNILTIRKILQHQTNQAIKTNDPLASLNLSKHDLAFIEKLKTVIEKHYPNEYFLKADLASKMTVSERQLQRKVKALIDEKPMNMLRDYRLKKATIKLKEGFQVGIVSDECGFSSVSYFGRCFKKKYGLTPKAYQQL